MDPMLANVQSFANVDDKAEFPIQDQKIKKGRGDSKMKLEPTNQNAAEKPAFDTLEKPV